MKRNDIFNAKGILDSMSKIFLVGDLKAKSNANVEINTSGNGQVTIKFGFDNDNNDDNVEDQEAEIIE